MHRAGHVAEDVGSDESGMIARRGRFHDGPKSGRIASR